MADYVTVGTTDELKDGTMKKVSVEGREVLLARAGDSYYAVQGRCPHLGGNLSAGRLEGTVVTCPRHGSQFDIRDGRVIRWTNWPGVVAAIGKAFKSPRPLQTFAVEIEGNEIRIKSGG